MERQRMLRKPNPRTSQEMEAEPNPPPQPEPEPSQPKTRKPRGSNNGREAQSQLSDRPKLTIVSNKEFDADPDCSKIPTTIRLIVCSNVNGPYTKFNEFPKDDRKQCLEEFLERYCWADDPVECEKVFHKIACDMYCVAMTAARRACRKKHGNNCQKWKEMRPDWLENEEAWNSMCDEWEKPSWQELSEQNTANRKAPGNLVNHVAGTRSAFRHAKKMKKANGGVAPTYEELFKETHVKKLTGEFCDSKSKEVSEKFTFYKANAVSPEEGDQEKWIRAVGGASHGRVYGVSGLIDVSKVVRNKRSRCDPASSQPLVTPPRVYTQEELEARIREERRYCFEHFANIYNHLGLQMPSFAGMSSEGSVESVQEGNADMQEGNDDGSAGPVHEE